jgi:hypothetical protein
MICLMFLAVGSLLANTMDDVWLVHKAEYPPTIDGQMDDIYRAASKERVVLVDPELAAPDDYLDCFGEAWLLWDENNIYILVKVVDDEISSTGANSYENDSIEYYFDGDNSKVVGPPYDGFDDVQMRIEYQDGDDETLYDTFPAGSEGAVGDWEAIDGDAFGYIIECAIPLAGVNVEPGSIFGFEIQINDRDNEARETMLRWWGTNNNAWQDASLFGEANCIEYVASDIMNVVQMPAPTIDGIIDAAWDGVPYIGMGTYVYTNADAIDGSFHEILEWEDSQMQFKLGWDADNMYLWCEVIDDEVSISGANSYENDSIELCWDGDNSKSPSPYDADDLQQRWVWSATTADAGSPTSTVAWGELVQDLEGYTCELAVPAADLPFTPEEGAELGFEIQINDRDNEIREEMMRWWGSDNMTWNDASRMGTILLTGPVAVGRDGQPESFMLSQNYPNPFNPTTHINFNLDRRSQVRLTVYDVLGNMVAELVNDVRNSGAHTVAFDGSNLTSGVYFYKLETPTEVVTKKMMLLK